MQTVQTDGARNTGPEVAEPVRIWIEDGRGAITRGLVDVISEDRGFVSLTDGSGFGSGDSVAVRLSFDRNSPTLAATARILWLRQEGETWEGELEWTHAGPERARLASLIAGLG